MSIYLSLIGPLRDLAQGNYETTIEANTIEQALEALKQHYSPELYHMAQKARITVNGQAIQFLNGKRTRLKDGDRLAIMMPVGGG